MLLAAGVGITPLLSMLREVVYQGQRTRHTRPSWLLQSSRSLADQPFRAELDRLLENSDDAVRVVRVLSQPEPEALEGVDFHRRGRIDLAWCKRCCRSRTTIRRILSSVALAVLPRRCTTNCATWMWPINGFTPKTFGPSTLRRRADPLAPVIEQPAAATDAVTVIFRSAQINAKWQPASGSLLELAESRGLRPEFSCRGGSCGTCRTRLISGQVNYPQPPAELPGAGEVLICCAIPAIGEQPLVLDL